MGFSLPEVRGLYTFFWGKTILLADRVGKAILLAEISDGCFGGKPGSELTGTLTENYSWVSEENHADVEDLNPCKAAASWICICLKDFCCCFA